MITFLGALAGGLVVLGVVVAIAAVISAPVTGRPVRQESAWRRRARRLPRGVRLAVIIAGVVGAVIAVTTGWLVAVVVLPLFAFVVPLLLGAGGSGQDQIQRLEAMEEWTRSLADVLTVGAGLEQAILATVRSAPEAISAEVTSLAARIRARWTTQEAIRTFADELDDSTGDLIAASLLLGAERRGGGLAEVLHGLAESVADDVRGRREVEADRAKPRSTARWATVLSLVFMILLFVFARDYMAPYSSPVGQLLLAVYFAAFIGVLFWLRQMTLTRPTPRFVGAALHDQAQGSDPERLGERARSQR